MPETTAPEATVPAPPPSARVAFFGDSTGLMTGYGFADWLATTGRGITVPGGATLGCSIMGPDELRLGERVSTPPGGCPQWPATWAEAVAASQPGTVVVQLGAWDVQDRRIGDDPEWRGPGDPVFDERMRQRMLEAVDVLSSGGATVVWLLAPVPSEGRAGRLPDPAYDAVAPRMVRINELVAEVAELRPDAVRVVDLAGWFEATGEQDRLRPDGMHFSRETAFEVTERFLGHAVLGPDWWNRPTEPPPAPDGT
nr:SGNH hydrolase domain-containing protein [Rhabdothermincola salaria]